MSVDILEYDRCRNGRCPGEDGQYEPAGAGAGADHSLPWLELVLAQITHCISLLVLAYQGQG